MNELTTFWIVVLNSFVLLFLTVGLNLHYKNKWMINVDNENDDKECPKNENKECPKNENKECPKNEEQKSCEFWVDTFALNNYRVADYNGVNRDNTINRSEYEFFVGQLLREVERTKVVSNKAFEFLTDNEIDKSLAEEYYSSTVAFAVVLSDFVKDEHVYKLLSNLKLSNTPLEPNSNINSDLLHEYSNRLVYSVYRTMDERLRADEQFDKILDFFHTFNVPDDSDEQQHANDWTKSGYAYDGVPSGLNRLLDLVQYFYVAWKAHGRLTGQSSENFSKQIEYAYNRIRLALNNEYVQARGSEDKLLRSNLLRARILSSLVYISEIRGKKLNQWFIRQLAYTTPGWQPYPLLNHVCPLSESDDIKMPQVFYSKKESFYLLRDKHYLLEFAFKPKTNTAVTSTLFNNENLLSGYLNYGCDYGLLLREYQETNKPLPVLAMLAGQITIGNNLNVPVKGDIATTYKKYQQITINYENDLRITCVHTIDTKKRTQNSYVLSNVDNKFFYCIFSWTTKNTLVVNKTDSTIHIYEYNKTFVIYSNTHQLLFAKLNLGYNAINGAFYVVYALVNDHRALNYTLEIKSHINKE